MATNTTALPADYALLAIEMSQVFHVTVDAYQGTVINEASMTQVQIAITELFNMYGVACNISIEFDMPTGTFAFIPLNVHSAAIMMFIATHKPKPLSYDQMPYMS